MNWRTRLTAADEPQEARVFLFISAFGLAVGMIYWFVSYETAGTVLLLAFGLATGLFGLRLISTPAARAVRDRARTDPAETVPQEDATGGGTGGVDRPFLDESGRLPNETIAPFAIGLGVSVAATGLIFGIAPVLVGALPFAWGAWGWLSNARAELDAEELEDMTGTRAEPPPETRAEPRTKTAAAARRAGSAVAGEVGARPAEPRPDRRRTGA